MEGHGKPQGTDAYGNPVRQTDEYGNPIQHTGGTMGDYGTHGTGAQMKKSITEKVKEKLPGGHKDQQQQHEAYPTSTTTPGGGAYGTEQPHEKKGMMEKIKEKLPVTGHH